MKTRDSPPPVHVHVSETTPVHVHMRRSPNKISQIKDAQRREAGGRSKAQIPWIPPGRLSSRRDVGSCKMQSWRKGSGMQHQSESGILIQQDMAMQEDELGATSKNLHTLINEQDNNPSSIKPHFDASQRETDQLLRALVETEIDGIAVASQLTALRETIDSLPKDKRLVKTDILALGRQQDLLMSKIEMFDQTNHSLRELLREWSECEKQSLLLSQQRESLKKRLVNCEADNVRLSAKLSNKEKEACKLAEHLDYEKDNMKTNEELSRLLESTRDHLEAQLNRKEAENSMMAAQLQRMQQTHDQQLEELQALQEELKTLRHQQEEEQQRKEQEVLDMLTQQADRAEESNRQLSAKLQEKESQLAQALSVSTDWCARHSKEVAAKAQLEEEMSNLKTEVAELISRLSSVDEKTRTEKEELIDQHHQLSTEHASTKLDNQRLKGQLMSAEEALREQQTETRRLKTTLKKQENLVEKYKTKVQQARLESEEYSLRLEVTQQEVRDVKDCLEKEKEQVRKKLLNRLKELEPLPDKLRRAEIQLREAQEEVDTQERRNIQHNIALTEVRHKVEQQGTQVETLQQRNVLLQEENNVLKEKLQTAERKLEETKLEMKEKSDILAMKDASIRSIQHQLDEKSCECSILSRQLEQTLDTTKKQVDDSMQRVLVKERVSQSKALELQTQLNRAKSELTQIHRSKDEMERRFHTQMKNMKERLDQTDSTNRTLQNYVQFLKTSYGNVFADAFPC